MRRPERVRPLRPRRGEGLLLRSATALFRRPQERGLLVFSLLMLDNDFIARSINVETLDPALKPAEIATSLVENAGLDSVMTN